MSYGLCERGLVHPIVYRLHPDLLEHPRGIMFRPSWIEDTQGICSSPHLSVLSPHPFDVEASLDVRLWACYVRRIVLVCPPWSIDVSLDSKNTSCMHQSYLHLSLTPPLSPFDLSQSCSGSSTPDFLNPCQLRHAAVCGRACPFPAHWSPVGRLVSLKSTVS